MSLNTFSTSKQYLISFALVIAASVACYFSVDFIGYRTVALILLMVVSLIAILFDIIPVIFTALLSALIWNFFFIPPVYTWNINSPEDTLLFLMYFVIASIHAVLTFKIKQMERRARDKEEKEKTIKLYGTLLNSLSHELRTPIATIIGSIDTINDNQGKLTESAIAELHGEIKIAGFRLNRQVENLLNMSRLESGTLKPKVDWCDVNEIIFTIIRESADDSQGHRIEFSPNETLPLFKTDRGFIEQVIYNIVYNAIYHTPINSTIKIEVEQADELCIISIADNGLGFPEKEIPSVFDKFYRLPSTSTGGVGLGLSIAKGFIEALNGKIQLENVPSGGAKFTIKIQAETASSNEIDHE